jgi:putative transposase
VGVLDASTSPPEERYAVPKDNVIKLIQPGFFDDQQCKERALVERIGAG